MIDGTFAILYSIVWALAIIIQNGCLIIIRLGDDRVAILSLFVPSNHLKLRSWPFNISTSIINDLSRK